MSKNINVEAHVNRYLVTELSDVVALIGGLQNLIEKRKGEAIAEYESKLAALRSGEVPITEKPVKPEKKKTRGGKPIAETEEETTA